MVHMDVLQKHGKYDTGLQTLRHSVIYTLCSCCDRTLPMSFSLLLATANFSLKYMLPLKKNTGLLHMQQLIKHLFGALV